MLRNLESFDAVLAQVDQLVKDEAPEPGPQYSSDNNIGQSS